MQTQATILTRIKQKTAKGVKQLAVLIDPDFEEGLHKTIDICNRTQVDYIFVGGSLVTEGNIDRCVATIKENTDIPVVLFPGSTTQLTEKADALLLLSLISGRNPDLLIGKHVESAPFIKQSGIDVIPTGYMLIDGGKITSVQYISNTIPIPADKPDIAMATAMAGELLGLQLIFMDAGSGAATPINDELIAKVKKSVNLPIVVGGGIKTGKQALTAWNAGADIVVIGNAVEKDKTLIEELSEAVAEWQV
jgi:putative glycerol-1-phosphate prenyltransferase